MTSSYRLYIQNSSSDSLYFTDLQTTLNQDGTTTINSSTGDLAFSIGSSNYTLLGSGLASLASKSTQDSVGVYFYDSTANFPSIYSTQQNLTSSAMLLVSLSQSAASIYPSRGVMTPDTFSNYIRAPNPITDTAAAAADAVSSVVNHRYFLWVVVILAVIIFAAVIVVFVKDKFEKNRG